MKKIIILLMLFYPLILIGQTTDSDLIPFEIPQLQFQAGEIIFREVVSFEEDQKKLHSIGLKSISELYRNSKSVIDLNDPENGLIIVKGVLPLRLNGFYVVLGGYRPLDVTYSLNHVLTIESRENRIRVSIDRFSFSSSESSDGQIMVFNPENKLDENYVEIFEQSLNISKPKKADIANTYNKSIIINELNLIALSLIEKIKEIYLSELEDDW